MKDLTLQKTAKFAVLDAPGIAQPKGDNEYSRNAAPREGGRATAALGPRVEEGSSAHIGGDSFSVRTKNPDWLKDRVSVYDAIASRRAEELARKVPVTITVTLPDGAVMSANKEGEEFKSWTTSPYHVACVISQGLADSSVVARVTYQNYVEDYDLAEDGMEGEDVMAESLDDLDAPSEANAKAILWDMTRPLVGNVAKLEFLKFDGDADAKTVFWHSTAHMLGEALEHVVGSRLTIGPPLKSGFYYDSYMGSKETISEEDYKPIEDEVKKITKAKQRFERLVVTKDEALELFSGNPFKEQLIKTKVVDGTRTTVYKCGDLIDLCRGPHIPHTGRVKAFAATRHSATQWLGDVENDSLQRMYGISFPDKKMLKAWKEKQELAKQRDHRRIMVQQELIMFHELSPGSAFWLPHGTRIYNNLVNFIREHYWNRGFHEVITPNMFNLDLWHQSGHAEHYKEDMFCFEVEGKEWAMKPMNCPAHCLIFANTIRSYRDLPIRIGDFGVLHRNELSGALSGLTRVRRFQQDDGHIFCREDQIGAEVTGALDFMQDIYKTFGMTYKLELSTRPKKALGEIGLWNRAEKALENSMNAFAGEGNWKINPGDGAFYGPKIDIKVMDAMGRVHQCATIQLDFQLPIRFDLKYNTGSREKGEEFKRPIIVHRAMLGSVERMFAVLCEHWGGKWPFWISPRQVIVLPVHAEFNEYCEEVRSKLHTEGFYVDVDLSRNTFQKKVRNAQIAQYNYQLIVGKSEVEHATVNIRNRENEVEGEKPIDELIAWFKDMRKNYQ